MALLLGDSIPKRLLDQYPLSYHPLSVNFCLSGEGAQMVKAMFKSFHGKIDTKPTRVILLVGINDISKSHDLSTVWPIYLSLVNYLLRQKVHVVLIQLLPVANRRYIKFQSKINTFNFWIRSLKQKTGVTILSFRSIFQNEVTGRYNKSLYCTTIKGRPDYLHPNSKGLQAIHLALQRV